MKMRKILAVLACLAMLCTILPMGAMTSVSADDDVIYSNNFNDGTLGFSKGSIVAVGPDGSNCMYWDAGTNYDSTSITLSPISNNTEYVITFKMKASSAGAVNITVQDTKWYSNNYYGIRVTPTTEWAEYSFTTNIQEYAQGGSIYFKFQETTSSDGKEFWIDDLVITKKGVPTSDNLITNGDFESGLTGWTTHSSTVLSTAAARNGNNGIHCKGSGWGGMLDRSFTVEQGKSYIFSFWYYINNTDGTGFTYTLKDNTNNTTYKSAYPNTAGAWTQISIEFVAGSDSLYFFFSGYNASSSPDFYADDFELVEVIGPSYDGYITNGDFEIGETTGWNVFEQTAVSADAGKDSNYGLVAKGNGGWGGLLNQSFAVQANRDYILRFDIKCVSQGLNVKITDELGVAGGNANAVLWTAYYDASEGTDWRSVEIYFNSGENTTAAFALVGSGKNYGTNATGIGDEVWFDNISIEKVGGDDPIPNTILGGGQVSIKDAAETSKGLAFRFVVNATGAEILNTNEYVSKSASVKLYKDLDDTFKLVQAGAVMTNNSLVGTGDMTLDNVDGKKTINVPAKYLCELNDDNFAFAVRILNIPDSALDTTIFARPYYIYEDADGNNIVAYGNTKSENYNHVANPKSSIKILAIGNSFSVDAMNNHLYKVLESAGYEEIVMGNLYIGGCSLDTHWSNMNSDAGAYDFYYGANNSSWGSSPFSTSYKVSDALAKEDWDYITIQQASPSSGLPNTYGNLQNILEYIDEHKTNPSAKILWHMTWAYDEVNTNSGYSNYGNDQMKMYKAILDTVNEKVLTNSLIDGVLPSGTAIQNMRTSTKIATADLCSSDGYHLSTNYGDYIAALTWYAYLSGEDVSGLAYQPTAITDAVRADINTSVNGAIANPYRVTKCASYDQSKSIKVLSIGHSFSKDVMGTYLYDMLEQAGYTDITLGYLYYPGCPLSRHWDWIENGVPTSYTADGKTTDAEFEKNTGDGFNLVATKPLTLDVVRNEDWDFVTFQASPDYVGGQNSEYADVVNMVNWIKDNCLNVNVEVKYHMIWAYSQGCDLWSNMYHEDANGNFSQAIMYQNIVNAAKQYVVDKAGLTESDIIPSGTSVQNGRALLGDIFNEPDATQGGSDGYHLNTKYGDFTGSLTWACYFSGVDAHTITARSDGMTEEEFSAIADAVNAALENWDAVTVE